MVKSTNKYPFSARPFVPGMAQIYKGQKARGALFITGEQEQLGSIYGVVTDANTGEPVTVASVELGIATNYDVYDQNLGWIPEVGIVKNRTVTGSDGQYEFQEVDAGNSYYVKVSQNG